MNWAKVIQKTYNRFPSSAPAPFQKIEQYSCKIFANWDLSFKEELLPLQGRSCITEICWSQDRGGFLNLWGGRHHVGGGGGHVSITEICWSFLNPWGPHHGGGGGQVSIINMLTSRKPITNIARIWNAALQKKYFRYVTIYEEGR